MLPGSGLVAFVADRTRQDPVITGTVGIGLHGFVEFAIAELLKILERFFDRRPRAGQQERSWVK
jgi:hypothetical protein